MIGDAHRFVHAIGLRIAERFAGELTQAEALILAHLGETGACSVGTLHTAFGHRRSTLTSALDRLESKSLVSTERSPDDARSIIVHLTREGKTRAAAVQRLFREIENAIPKRACEALAQALPHACDALL